MTIALIVSIDELADHFDCDRRSISNLQRAGIIKPVSRARFDLRDCSRAYARYHRAVAGQHNTKDAKGAALQALTALRDAQRFAIERKGRDYIEVETVKQLAEIASTRAKQKLLEPPLRLRQRIEDNFPTAFKTMREAIGAEDAIDAVCCEILQEIADTPPDWGLEGVSE